MDVKEDSIVWGSTRQSVTAFLDLIAGDPTLDSIANSVGVLEQQAGEDLRGTITAFATAMSHRHPRARAVAATMLLRLRASYPRLVRKQVEEQATHVLVETMRSGDESDRRFLCILSSIVTPPAAYLTYLVEMYWRGDGMSRLYASVALLSIDARSLERFLASGRGSGRNAPPGISIHTLLREVREGTAARNSPATRSICASALVRAVPDSAVDLRRVMSVLASVPSELCLELLASLKLAQVTDPTLVADLKAVAENAANLGAIRGCALEAIGAVGGGDDDSVQTLVRALSDEEPLVVRGAFRALCHAAVDHNQLASHYIRLLNSDCDQIRLVGADGLAKLRPIPPQGIDALISRIGPETDQSLGASITRALAAAGVGAIPALVDATRDRDTIKTGVAVIILGRIGLEAGEFVVRQFLAGGDDDDWMGQVMVAVLSQLGRAAEPLAPLLAAEIRKNPPYERSAYCILAIDATWTTNPEVADALAVCAVLAPDDLAERAQAALARIGLPAVPVIQEILAGIPEGRVDRLHEVLRLIAPGINNAPSLSQAPSARMSTEQQALLARVKSTRALWIFWHIVYAFVGLKATSLDHASKLLRTYLASNPPSDRVPTSASTFSGALKKLEDETRLTLFDRTEGRDSVLTADGMQLYEMATTHFAQQLARSRNT